VPAPPPVNSGEAVVALFVIEPGPLKTVQLMVPNVATPVIVLVNADSHIVAEVTVVVAVGNASTVKVIDVFIAGSLHPTLSVTDSKL
jgi:hypothetical protein